MSLTLLALFAGAASAVTPPSTGDTGAFAPTGDTATSTGGSTTPTATPPTDTGGTLTTETGSWDTGPQFCAECDVASEIAGDPGGSPCEQGCSTGGRVPAGLLWLPALVLVRRRTR